MKKKLIGIALVLGVGLMAVSGCNTATSTAPTESPDASALADSIGGLMNISTVIDGTARGLMGISSAGALKAMAAADDLHWDGTWWTFTSNVSTMAYTFKAKAYTAAGAPITTEGALNTTNKLEMVCTLTMGSSLTYHFGTDSSPLIFDGLISGAKTLNGTISLALTESTGSTYNITIVYSGVTLDSYGYPASGSVTFTFTSSDYATVAATLTFNGDQTATFTITEPADIASSWTIDLATGNATPASI